MEDLSCSVRVHSEARQGNQDVLRTNGFAGWRVEDSVDVPDAKQNGNDKDKTYNARRANRNNHTPRCTRCSVGSLFRDMSSGIEASESIAAVDAQNEHLKPLRRQCVSTFEADPEATRNH
jgi:hypothetical protein